MDAYYDQRGYAARFEWGGEGVERLAPGSDVVVIVDVLTFSTAVGVAVERGAAVYPYRWRDASAAAYANELQAALAVSRSLRDAAHPYSLSPATLQTLPDGARLVLPSPNGATLTVLAAATRATILAGCLRNAGAVAAAAGSLGGSVTVIAAGERWDAPGDPMRPAIEDLLGAGAILAALQPANPSPEARIAMAAFDAAKHDLSGFLHACSSGRELHEMGYADDVSIAARLNASAAVPVLRERAFTRWAP